MPKLIEIVPSFLALFFLQLGCSNNCSPEKANVFREVTKSDILNLEKINDLVLRNVNTLIKVNESNEFDSVRGRNDKFHLIPTGHFGSYLSKRDSIDLINYTESFNAIKNKFYFHKVYFRPSDSTFDYELRVDICDSSTQAIDITHHLLYRTNMQNYDAYKNEEMVKEMKIDKFWTYYIDNTPNDPF